MIKFTGKKTDSVYGEVRSSRAGIGIGLSLVYDCCCYSSTPSIQETHSIGGNLGSRYIGMSSSSQD